MKRTPLKRGKGMRKSSPKKKYDKYLDDLWRTVIRLRDKGIDQYKYLTKGIRSQGFDAHHIFSRKILITRWDTRNGILLCAGHNNSDAHIHPERFRQFLIEKWFKSESEYQRMFALSQIIGTKIDRVLCELRLLQELSEFTTLPDDWKALSDTKKRGYLKMLRQTKIKSPL
jgi:hypothetical protein